MKRKTIRVRDVPALQCKTGFIVQRAESDYTIVIRKPNLGEEFQLVDAEGKPVSFMSIETAARLLRHIPIRDMRLQML
ncbi:hypothetical protein BK812_0022 [Pectobacterium phage A38]|uniref:Uncharacterized protein n=2 Tax=Cbunavirus A41 TaxID=2845779 RepID=A0A7I6I6G0_9CAUD|nr:hypothetical protein HWB14_gp22 [Pectobacterium phage phiA41]APD19095.1 hypothetical protein BK812_0022 [Pectobacterium phage A38]ARB11024.1 hypothetical protein B4963_0022 [Pectobacterium phage phiA41]